MQNTRPGGRSLPVCADVTKGHIEIHICRSSTEHIVGDRAELGSSPITAERHRTSILRPSEESTGLAPGRGEPFPIQVTVRSPSKPGFLNRGLELRLEDSRSQSLTC